MFVLLGAGGADLAGIVDNAVDDELLFGDR
jgi:hypothetical protein